MDTNYDSIRCGCNSHMGMFNSQNQRPILINVSCFNSNVITSLTMLRCRYQKTRLHAQTVEQFRPYWIVILICVHSNSNLYSLPSYCNIRTKIGYANTEISNKFFLHIINNMPVSQYLLVACGLLHLHVIGIYYPIYFCIVYKLLHKARFTFFCGLWGIYKKFTSYYIRWNFTCFCGLLVVYPISSCVFCSYYTLHIYSVSFCMIYELVHETEYNSYIHSVT